MTISKEIHEKISELIQNPGWDEPRTFSGFVENAVSKEIKRVERIRRKKEPMKAVQ
ncbi:MAG: hypothetical protein ACRECH_16940 [Nitrososphaerales archaeon]